LNIILLLKWFLKYCVWYVYGIKFIAVLSYTLEIRQKCRNFIEFRKECFVKWNQIFEELFLFFCTFWFSTTSPAFLSLLIFKSVWKMYNANFYIIFSYMSDIVRSIYHVNIFKFKKYSKMFWPKRKNRCIERFREFIL